MPSYLKIAVLAIACLAAATSPVSAAYPDQPIRVICGYAAGSGADVIVRFFASRLESHRGKPARRLWQYRDPGNGVRKTRWLPHHVKRHSHRCR